MIKKLNLQSVNPLNFCDDNIIVSFFYMIHLLLPNYSTPPTTRFVANLP